jgi:hypothetical protein
MNCQNQHRCWAKSFNPVGIAKLEEKTPPSIPYSTENSEEPFFARLGFFSELRPRSYAPGHTSFSFFWRLT